MDLTYQNNKGLYAFIMAFMIILAVFLPSTSSYAATAMPTEPFKVFKIVESNQANMNTNSTLTWLPIDRVRIVDSSDDWMQYYTGFTVIDKASGKDISSKFKTRLLNQTSSKTQMLEYFGTEQIAGNTKFEVSFYFSKLIPHTVLHSTTIPSDTSRIESMSFYKTAPPLDVKVPVEVQKVKDLPATLGKVAGIATLVGCLILGTLLAAGSVKRLLSLFLR